MSCSWNTWDLWLAISSYLERFPRRRVATPWFLPCFLPLSTAKPVFDSVSPRIVTIKSYLTCWLFRIFFIFRWSDFFEFLFTPKEKYSWEFLRILIGKSCAQVSKLFKVTRVNGKCILVTNSRYVSFHLKREGRGMVGYHPRVYKNSRSYIRYRRRREGEVTFVDTVRYLGGRTGKSSAEYTDSRFTLKMSPRRRWNVRLVFFPTYKNRRSPRYGFTFILYRLEFGTFVKRVKDRRSIERNFSS